MSSQPMKHHDCPRCGRSSTLLMDIGEKVPRRDEKHNLLYYCAQCRLSFAVDAHGNAGRKK